MYVWTGRAVSFLEALYHTMISFCHVAVGNIAKTRIFV